MRLLEREGLIAPEPPNVENDDKDVNENDFPTDEAAESKKWVLRGDRLSGRKLVRLWKTFVNIGSAAASIQQDA
jgi:hypothetical protein